MGEIPAKSIGQAIDEIVLVLQELDDSTKSIVLKTVIEHLNIRLLTSLTQRVISQNNPVGDEDLNINNLNHHEPPLLDIKSFKEIKSPKTAIEMACIVAYYLRHHAPQEERKDEITKAELEKYFVQAKFPLPKVMQQVLVDAKTSGYFDSSQKGIYKLNPVGHNLVAHKLPRIKK